jgi:CheY-like chemotaxis protein
MPSTPDKRTEDLVRSLIGLLESEGIRMNPRAAIDLYNVLARTDLEKFDTLSKLKYRIAPVLCRNKEEQEDLYAILEKSAAANTAITAVAGATDETPEEPPPRKNIFETLRRWQKAHPRTAGTAAAIIALLLFSGLLYRLLPSGREKARPALSLSFAAPAVIRQPVTVLAHVTDTAGDPSAQVRWTLADSTVTGPASVTITFSRPGYYPVIAAVTNGQGAVLDVDTLMLNVLCETPPEVSIVPVTDFRQKSLLFDEPARGKAAPGAAAAAPSTRPDRKVRFRYRPRFRNASPDSARYRYQWFVNDSLVSEARELSYTRPANQFNGLRLKVDCNGLHCSTDTMFASLQEIPPVTVALMPGAPAATPPAGLPLQKLLLFALLLLPPFLLAPLVYRYFRKRVLPPEELPPGKKEPYSIVFNDQEHLIDQQQEVNKLADVLRKRQIGDLLRLNVRKTIQASIASGGLPQLHFSRMSTASDYLILLDKEYQNSHITRLYQYLLKKLQREQVNIIVYEYYKEPLYVSNDQLHHKNIPIDRLTALYKNPTLLIFGDSRHFVYPIKGKLKSWVAEKTAAWSKKIFVTCYAPEDWDKKEKLLASAGFTVIPSDIDAQIILDDILFNSVDAPEKIKLPRFYPARFLNLNEPGPIRDYLGDERLFRYVCALAIYPRTDWNLTLAIGHALEEEWNKEGTPVQLVTYSNLLKLGRISWMHDTKIADTLRVQLLGLLDGKTEAVARRALLEQLASIKDIHPEALAHREFETQYSLNRFLKKLYYNEHITPKEKAVVHRLLQKGRVDNGTRIYLNKAVNPLFRRKKGIDAYFRRWRISAKLAAWVAACLTFVGLASFSYTVGRQAANLHTTAAPVSKTLLVRNTLPNRQPMELLARFGDSVRQVRILNDTTLTFTGLSAADSTRYGHIRLWMNNDDPLISDSFLLNREHYTVMISEPQTLSLTVRYAGIGMFRQIDDFSELLPAYFRLSLQHQASGDTAFRVYFYDTLHLAQAFQCASIVNNAFGRNIVPEQVDSIFLAKTGSVIVISIPALPPPENSQSASVNLPQRIPNRSPAGVNTSSPPPRDTAAVEDTSFYYPVNPQTQQQQQQQPDGKMPPSVKKKDDDGGDRQPQVSAPAGASPRVHILWVDDHPENNTTLIEYFKKYNYLVTTVTSNREALALLSGASPPVSLVITDVGRDAKGVDDGMDLMRMVKKLRRNFPFVIYTSEKQIKRYQKDAYGYDVTVTDNPVVLTQTVEKLIKTSL